VSIAKIVQKEVAEMARIGRKGRLWLRAFHIFPWVIYRGNISVLVIFASTGSAQSDGGLQAMYKIPDMLSLAVAPCAVGTFITGLLLSWLTPWGFFRHKWVVYTLAVGILVTLVFFILSLPLSSKLTGLAEAEGLRALQNPEYISARNTLIVLEPVKLLLVISAAFVSVIKPWRKRDGAEATS
jgi:uncharacterized membrane protein